MSAHPLRLKALDDLTRWNRAGLSRFAYVDGNAATWLEELRLAVMGLTARGADMELRLPETWRHLFEEDPANWPDAAEQSAFRDHLVWKALWAAFPDQPETARQRNERLVSQYASTPRDEGWEIMRASSRLAQVLLGHLEAYANEGYLRTASQWDNVRRLAAMVNYQPAPPTSATTTVGLIVNPSEDSKAIEIDRGLAMKYAPPEGGSPVVFETLKFIKAHAALSKVRCRDWNHDSRALLESDLWIDEKEAQLAPGALTVLAGAAESSVAIILDAERNEDAGTVELELDFDGTAPERGNAMLHIEPKAVRRGAPRSTEGVLVLAIETSANYPVGSLVQVYDGNTKISSLPREVLGNTDGHLKLRVGSSDTFATGQELRVEAMVVVSGSKSGVLAPKGLGADAYYMHTSGIVKHVQGLEVYPEDLSFDTEGDVKIRMLKMEAVGADKPDLWHHFSTDKSRIVGYDLSKVTGVVGSFYLPAPGAKREIGIVVAEPGIVIPGDSPDNRIVSFLGKPPKGLAVGDVFVRSAIKADISGQGVAAATAPLVVAGVAERSGTYDIQFEEVVTSDYSAFEPDAHEFHGPMTRTLRPSDHDKSHDFAFEGPRILLGDLAAEARALLRLGKLCLVEDERDEVEPALASLIEAGSDDDGYYLLFSPHEGLDKFIAGWTRLNLNAVEASHGETKSPKVLGSGNAERTDQAFALSAKEISFIPSNVAETGVAPDVDVTVDGALWSYRDFVDPTADGTDSYSTELAEDGSLVFHFRRRLPTGTDNVVVRRHRVGVGPRGSVPAGGFTKPMKKHRFISEIRQPLAANGGADREPISDIRSNAPARLAANGRAVSIADFERLCRRRSDVWQAGARMLNDPTSSEDVGIIVVPANGGRIGDQMRAELIEFIEAKAIPGTRVRIDDYVSLPVAMDVEVRVDIEAFDKTEVQAAAQSTLFSAFSLANRALGQPLYLSEAVAVLERVTGVETARVLAMSIAPTPPIKRTASTGGETSAYFPFDDQVIVTDPLEEDAEINVLVEPIR